LTFECLCLRGRLRLTTTRRLSAYMSSRAQATTTTSSYLYFSRQTFASLIVCLCLARLHRLEVIKLYKQDYIEKNVATPMQTIGLMADAPGGYRPVLYIFRKLFLPATFSLYSLLFVVMQINTAAAADWNLFSFNVDNTRKFHIFGLLGELRGGYPTNDTFFFRKVLSNFDCHVKLRLPVIEIFAVKWQN